MLSVDTDFDLYWEEEARNPHRNRIRIGRQYQATVPSLLKDDNGDSRKLEHLETLKYCPKKSTHVSDAELSHYFKVAKSLNIFASLVETRSLLGRDVTIADLNHIRRKEGLNLASVIQPPPRQAAAAAVASICGGGNNSSIHNSSPTSSQQNPVASSSQSDRNPSPSKSPSSVAQSVSNISVSNADQSSQQTNAREHLANIENQPVNKPLMKALSHFISLHHPCHHDEDCKKLSKSVPSNDQRNSVTNPTSAPAEGPSSSQLREAKPGRSRSSIKHLSSNDDESSEGPPDATSYEDWSHEEIDLFSKAIEICGKNFGSIKKEFLPSKSVRSIVEYYYIGLRDNADSKTKKYSAHTSESNDTADKTVANVDDGDSYQHPSSLKTNVITSSITTATSSAIDSLQRTQLDGVNSLAQSSLAACNSAADFNGLSSDQKQTNSKALDARMSVYNFDDEFREDTIPNQRLDCQAKIENEVKPLKAKAVRPSDSPQVPEASNSNVGSLKFFMDGQLVLKLNACQGQQEGTDKCHWVQSGERVAAQNKQKRYTKRMSSDRPSTNNDMNGSQSDSMVSSFFDDDSKMGDMSGDEDSKESINSSSTATQLPKSQQNSPTPKRVKIRSDSTTASPNPGSQQQQHAPVAQQQTNQIPAQVDYNRLAVNNCIKDRYDGADRQSSQTATSTSGIPPGAFNPAHLSQAMPWLPANSFAMAAALFGGLNFSSPAAAAAAAAAAASASGNMMSPQEALQQSAASLFASQQSSQHQHLMNASIASHNRTIPTTKPMDLSVEHSPTGVPATTKTPTKSRSRSRSKTNTNANG